MAVFYPHERLALFIDGANLYAAARALGFDIDYKRLLSEFSKKGYLIRAFYYTALTEDQEYSPIRPLIDWLDYNGFTMVTKPVKEFTDASGRRKIKGNMDIEIAVDMMEIMDRMDHAVLFSGDGDFRRLVEAIQRRGVRVTVVSTMKSQPPMVADDLRRQADNYIDLADISSMIARGSNDRNEEPIGSQGDSDSPPRGRGRPATNARDDADGDDEDGDEYEDEDENGDHDSLYDPEAYLRTFRSNS